MSIRSTFKHWCGPAVTYHSHRAQKGGDKVVVWFRIPGKDELVHHVERGVFEGESRNHVAKALGLYAKQIAEE